VITGPGLRAVGCLTNITPSSRSWIESQGYIRMSHSMFRILKGYDFLRLTQRSRTVARLSYELLLSYDCQLSCDSIRLRPAVAARCSLSLYHISLTAAVRTHFNKNHCVSCERRMTVVRILKVARLPQSRRLNPQHTHYFCDFFDRFLTSQDSLETTVRHTQDFKKFSSHNVLRLYCDDRKDVLRTSCGYRGP
jgi:hypothetical protein